MHFVNPTGIFESPIKNIKVDDFNCALF